MEGSGMNFVNASDAWQAVLGILLPLLVATVTQKQWKPGTKSAVMVILVALTTIIGLFAEDNTHPVTLREWFITFCTVFVLTVTTYRHVWKPMGVSERIEEKINVIPSGASSPAPARAASEEPQEEVTLQDPLPGEGSDVGH